METAVPDCFTKDGHLTSNISQDNPVQALMICLHRLKVPPIHKGYRFQNPNADKTWW